MKSSSDHRAEHFKRKSSHLGQVGTTQIEKLIVDSGASLHMLSINQLSSGEKDSIRKSREPAVITTSSDKAESTEEATVYVDDFDVFATMMLLEHSPAVLSLGLLCEEMGCSYEWAGTVSVVVGQYSANC